MKDVNLNSRIKPNKRAIAHVQKVLDDHRVDPFEGMVEIVNKRNAAGDAYYYDVGDRITCLKELAQYVAPKLKSVEHKLGDDGTPLQFVIANFGGMPNANIGNDTRSIESGGYGSVQQPLRLHDKSADSAATPAEIDNPSSSSDGWRKPESVGDECNSPDDDSSWNDDER
jgi:hypothetical protein